MLVKARYPDLQHGYDFLNSFLLALIGYLFSRLFTASLFSQVIRIDDLRKLIPLHDLRKWRD